jgi:hypothetical protein
MRRSPVNYESQSNEESPLPKPLSTVQLFSKEHILQEWKSAICDLAQRETEMMTMSKDFAEYIKSVKEEMDVMLQANQTMLEESRRRGLHLKKLEAFFAEFPFPHSLRQPVASAFMSVGIQMPWWNGQLETQQPVPVFADTDIVDTEDLCLRFRSVLEMKDHLAQKLLDSQARHEEEMEALILHHKKSVITAQHNAMLSVTHWTIEKMTLQSRIQEKEAEVKIMQQELQLLKQGIEQTHVHSDFTASQSRLLDQLSKKKEVNRILEIDRSMPLANRHQIGAFSPRTTAVMISHDIPFGSSNVLGQSAGFYHEDTACTQQQHKELVDTPRNSLQHSSATPYLSLSSISDAVHQQWVPQQSEQHNKDSPQHLVASMSNMFRGLKGTKICSEFRNSRIERSLGSPGSTRIMSE